eukprot:COSAG02_NODE_24483_length_689_cov_0.486395_1_plen_46_part_10
MGFVRCFLDTLAYITTAIVRKLLGYADIALCPMSDGLVAPFTLRAT